MSGRYSENAEEAAGGHPAASDPLSLARDLTTRCARPQARRDSLTTLRGVATALRSKRAAMWRGRGGLGDFEWQPSHARSGR